MLTPREKMILEKTLRDFRSPVCPEYFRARLNGVCHGCGYAYDDNGNCKCNGGK